MRRARETAWSVVLWSIGWTLAGCGGANEEVSTPTVDAGGDSSPEVTVEAGATPDVGTTPDVGDSDRPDAAKADAPVDQGESDGDGDGGACPPGAAAPAPNQPWVTTYAADILAHLTGEMDVAAGVRLSDRGSARTRQQARDYLSDGLKLLGLSPQLHAYGTGTNLFAQLDATAAPAPTVVVGAHYDTVAGTPGANDNGSGTAVVMALARYLTQVPCRSKNVLFVLFDEEEVGLIGSRAFATKLAADGVRVHSVHSVDQVGWDSNHDRLIELERPDPGLRQLYEQAAQELGITSTLKTTNSGGTDHVSFRPRFLAIGVTEGYASGDTTPYRHQPGDRAATIDLEYLKLAETLMAQVLADLVK